MKRLFAVGLLALSAACGGSSAPSSSHPSPGEGQNATPILSSDGTCSDPAPACADYSCTASGAACTRGEWKCTCTVYEPAPEPSKPDCEGAAPACPKLDCNERWPVCDNHRWSCATTDIYCYPEDGGAAVDASPAVDAAPCALPYPTCPKLDDCNEFYALCGQDGQWFCTGTAKKCDVGPDGGSDAQ